MSDKRGHCTSGVERRVAKQVRVTETTFVGNKDTGKTTVSDIEVVPPSADLVHPDVAKRLQDDFGVESLHEYDLYVANACDLDSIGGRDE